MTKWKVHDLEKTESLGWTKPNRATIAPLDEKRRGVVNHGFMEATLQHIQYSPGFCLPVFPPKE